MLSELTAEEKIIISTVKNGMDEIASRPDPPVWSARASLDLREQREFGPRYSPALLWGPIPERHRARLLASVWRLHEKGIVIATRIGTRLGFVRLTDIGLKLADDLTAAERTEADPKPG